MNLSIALPTYNRATYLRRAVESIETQRFHVPDGVIVTVSIYDNQSTDDTAVVCGELISRYPWIQVTCRPENIGGDANILDALSSEQGDFIWVLGDDDYLRAGALARICRVLAAGSFDVLKLGHLEERDLAAARPSFRPSKPPLTHDVKAQVGGAPDDLLLKFGMGMGNFSSIIFSREFFRTFYRPPSPQLFDSGYSQLDWIYRGVHERPERFGHVVDPVLVLRIETSPRDVSPERVGLGLGILRDCLVEMGYAPAAVETFQARQRDAILLGQVKARKIVGAPVLRELAGTLSGLSNFRQRVKLLVIAALPAELYRKLWVRL